MYILIIIILLVIFWPWISRWLKEFMSHRAEDAMRRMMGMPSRKEEQRRRKQQAQSETRRNTARKAQREKDADREAAVRSMKENAVDVEYTEYKEFSQTEIAVEDNKGNTRIYSESQVTDVEYVEIKQD